MNQIAAMEQPSPHDTTDSSSQKQPPDTPDPLPPNAEDLIAELQTLLAIVKPASDSSKTILTRAINITNQLATQVASCPICYHILRDPETTSCNHTFCKECLQTWLSESNTCPTCRRVIGLAPRPAALQRALSVTPRIRTTDPGDLRLRIPSLLNGWQPGLRRNAAIPDLPGIPDPVPPEVDGAGEAGDSARRMSLAPGAARRSRR